MTHIATIPKNSREELRITIEEFKGHRLLNLRIWYYADGEFRPGKQGVALKLDLLHDLSTALQRVKEVEATG